MIKSKTIPHLGAGKLAKRDWTPCPRSPNLVDFDPRINFKKGNSKPSSRPKVPTTRREH